MSKLTLADFAPRTVTVKLEENGVTLLEVDIAAMSYADFHSVDLMYPMPAAPMKRDFDTAQNKIVLTEDKDAPEWAEYERARDNAIEDRTLYRVAQMLIRAGNLPELAGKEPDEQIAALRRFDRMYLERLVYVATMMYSKARASFNSDVERFPTGRGTASGDAGVPAQRVDAGDVVVAVQP